MLLIALQGKSIQADSLPPTNIVFLLDVSGSMSEELPLLQESMMMLSEKLRDKDRVSIVVYAGAAGCVLKSTPGSEKEKIKKAIENLESGGSTAGGEGINLAYKIAKENFIEGGNNRIILATDGDFNVGVSDEKDLEKLIEKERTSGVFLTCLGFGTGNYQDSKMEILADKGNGNYFYIDTRKEAKKVLLQEFGGTIFTVAKDVKIQLQFNKENVQAYRLIGYENRMMKKEDFENDKKDAGDMGSDHTVTAIYEIIPAGVVSKYKIDEQGRKLKFEYVRDSISSIDMGLVKVRYKNPADSVSMEIKHSINKVPANFANASENFRFASAVALCGMIMKDSKFKGKGSMPDVEEIAKSATTQTKDSDKQEFLELVNKLKALF